MKIFGHIFTAGRRGDSDVESVYVMNAFLIALSVGIGLLGWFLLSYLVFKDFSPLSYWSLSETGFWHTLTSIWWFVLIYAFVMGQLRGWFKEKRFVRERNIDSENIAFKGLVSLSAGFFEELGYRGVFIFFGMIAVWFANWAWFIVFWIFAAGIILAALGKEGIGIVGKLILLALAGGLIFLTVWLGFAANPIYWIFENIIFPIYNFLSLGYLSTLLFEKYPFILMAGAFTANGWFKDGHKYLGLVGVLNAQFFGVYMICVAFTYGLVYAIALHFLYDLVLFSSEHLVALVRNRKASEEPHYYF
jgi:hypothetical protein